MRAERERKRMKTIFRIWWRARISRVRLSKDKKISVGGDVPRASDGGTQLYNLASKRSGREV